MSAHSVETEKIVSSIATNGSDSNGFHQSYTTIIGRPLKSLKELQSITDQLVLEYSNLSPTNCLEKALDSLEMFDNEINKLKQFKYCDYESAYIYYKTTTLLLGDRAGSGFLNQDTERLYSQLASKALGLRSNFDQIQDYIKSHSRGQVLDNLTSIASYSSAAEDPLLSRFHKLKSRGFQGYTHMPSQTSISNYDSCRKEEKYNSSASPLNKIPRSRSQSPSVVSSLGYQNGNNNEVQGNEFTNLIHRESISAEELFNLMKLYPNDILLVDLRPRTDFDRNHINFNHIVNVEPTMVKDDFNTDKDLEVYLSSILPSNEFVKFAQRSKYELLVIYDNDSEKVYPSNKLKQFINLLAFRNMLFENKLKRYPLHLSGGISAWLERIGSGSVKKTELKLSFPTPTKLMNKRNSLSSPISPAPLLSAYSGSLSPNPNFYAKTFNDYLSNNMSSKPSMVVNHPNNFVTTSSDKSPISRPISTLGHPIYHQQFPISKSPISSSKPSLKSSSSKPESRKIDMTVLINDFSTGIQNLGNSCYMNCVLQCLAGTPALVSLFLNGYYRQYVNLNNKLGTKGLISNQFYEVLKLLVFNDGKYVVPQVFKKIIGSLNNDFQGNYQQDCIEFLNYLLDILHEDLNKFQDGTNYKNFQLSEREEQQREKLPIRIASTIEWERYLKMNFSIIVDFFQGQYSSKLKCLTCSTTSTTYNSFSILSLPIPDSNNHSNSVTLDDCIEKFCSIEILDGDDKWFCPHCKTKERSSKILQITRLPSILIIHFKRFKNGNFLTKLNTMIKYPVNESLNLTNYLPTLTNKQDLIQLNSLPLRNQIPPFNYRLYGVINHFGNLKSGHYTSYVHKGENKKWCYFDDIKVTTNVDSKNVMNQNAYCLFYKRV